MNRETKILSLFEKLVSPYSIIYELVEFPPRYCDLPIHAYAGKVGILENKTTGYFASAVYGAGFSKEEALCAVLGEAAERYAWAMPSEEEIILASEEELASEHIPINKAGVIFDKELDHQSFLRKIKTAIIPWIPAKNSIDSSKILAPAVSLFPEKLPQEIREKVFSTTCGIAAGTSYDEACLYAIYEVIERDATMQFWYKRSRGKQVIWNTSRHMITRLFEKVESLNLQVGILNITTDIPVPSVLAYVYYNKRGSECITFGSASRLSLQEAYIKALIEAASLWSSIHYFKKYRKPLSRDEISLGFPSINNFEDHVFLYTHSWAREGYDFLFDSYGFEEVQRENNFNEGSIEQQLDNLIKILKTRGYQVYIVDITPKDLKSLGLFVVKAFIPGFVPLFVGKSRTFNCARLPETAITNRWPHPFP